MSVCLCACMIFLRGHQHDKFNKAMLSSQLPHVAVMISSRRLAKTWERPGPAVRESRVRLSEMSTTSQFLPH